MPAERHATAIPEAAQPANLLFLQKTAEPGGADDRECRPDTRQRFSWAASRFPAILTAMRNNPYEAPQGRFSLRHSWRGAVDAHRRLTRGWHLAARACRRGSRERALGRPRLPHRPR